MKKITFIIIFACVMQAVFSQALMLWGGRNHDIFLGYLNTDKYQKDSIWNKYGDFGSKYNTKSIWNEFGDFGSKFNSYSPWNNFSTNAPVIVDQQGNCYGYFSTNKFHPKRTKIDWIIWILDNYDWIKDNIDEAYDSLFN